MNGRPDEAEMVEPEPEAGDSCKSADEKSDESQTDSQPDNSALQKGPANQSPMVPRLAIQAIQNESVQVWAAGQSPRTSVGRTCQSREMAPRTSAGSMLLSPRRFAAAQSPKTSER